MLSGSDGPAIAFLRKGAILSTFMRDALDISFILGQRCSIWGVNWANRKKGS